MNKTDGNRNEAIELIEALCQDRITAKGMARLEALVLADPAVRSLYVRYLHMHASLPLFVRDQADGAASASDEAAIMQELEAMDGAASVNLSTRSEADSNAAPNFGELSTRPSIAGTRQYRKSRSTTALVALFRRMMHVGGESPVAAALTWIVMAIILSGTVLTAVFIGMMIFGAKPPIGQPAVAGSGEQKAGSREHGAGSTAPNSTLPAPSSSPVARLIRTVDCRWETGSAAPKSGDDLLPGRKLNLKAGLAQIIFQGGAATVLEGPATLEISSRTGAFLQKGKFRVTVENPLARGFEVRTPGMKYTDLGTEFGVWVAKDGTQEMHVFRGTVRAEAAASEETKTAVDSGLKPRVAVPGLGQAPVLLTASQAVRVAGAGKPIERVAYNEKRFVRTTLAPTPFPVFGTGVNLDRGGADAHWQITEVSSEKDFRPRAAVVADPLPVYVVGPRNEGQWIAKTQALEDMTNGCRMTFRTHFDLTGFDASSARIEGKIFVDDYVAEIRLNGKTVPVPPGSRAGFLMQKPLRLVIEDGFIEGINTLEIVIENSVIDPAEKGVPGNAMALCVQCKGTARPGPKGNNGEE